MGPVREANAEGELVHWVADNLNRIDSQEILPQIQARLNQWLQREKPEVAWEQDALLQTLPENLQNLNSVLSLGVNEYNNDDVRFLQETVWLRDIARTARGGKFEDLAVAQNLFDWTIRNIQLEPEPEDNQPHWRTPGEIVMLGRGRALERAWVFMLLARQQGLNMVMLAVAPAESGDEPRPWLPALLSDGELYLFDTQLALPIPGPGEQPVATLSQVLEQEALLRQLDLGADQRYPIEAADLQNIVALVEASPGYLARRTKALEAQLSGQQRVVLSVAASSIAEQLKGVQGVRETRLWEFPYQVRVNRSNLSDSARQAGEFEMVPFQFPPIRPIKRDGKEEEESLEDFGSVSESLTKGTRRAKSGSGKRGDDMKSPLLVGRLLHFRGEYNGEDGAKRHYILAWPKDSEIEALGRQLQVEQQIRQSGNADAVAFTLLAAKRMQQSAIYWLGLVTFEEKEFPTAISYFRKVMESDSDGSHLWKHGARYNLGRAYEASGQIDRAIALYQADTSPQSYGNKLRARRLAAMAAKSAEK